MRVLLPCAIVGYTCHCWGKVTEIRPDAILLTSPKTCPGGGECISSWVAPESWTPEVVREIRVDGLKVWPRDGANQVSLW